MNAPEPSSETSAWFSSRRWLNGLPLIPHESIDQAQFAHQYRQNPTRWDKAFEFLKNNDLAALATGKYTLMEDDEVFVGVNEYVPKEMDPQKWEAHRRYIDIQCVARGTEKIGLVPLSEAVVFQPYDEEKDVAFFTTQQGKQLLAQPGTFFLFFPSDVHLPGIQAEDTNDAASEGVKKIVVKIKAG